MTAEELVAENERLRDERDLFASIVSSPAQLLNHLLDTRGVEASFARQWGELPGCINIPADLARQVFA